MRVALFIASLAVAAFAAPARAQGTFINQDEVEEILSVRADDVNSLPEVYYEYYDIYEGAGNAVIARNNFYKAIGSGDPQKGHLRARLVELINRIDLGFLQPGEKIVVPDTFDLDFRAYSPFPRNYPGAESYDKLFIIHKSIQAWAAYEHGELARWGLVSTGDPKVSPTPTGRFNFNWKEPYRVSSLSPEDEAWEMYWVFNFHADRGVHIHQYDMPTDGPGSHGCVRLVDADARWIFDWAEPWTVSDGTVNFNSNGKPIKKQGSTVLVLGDDPTGKPNLFEKDGDYPVMTQVELPADPMKVPAGSAQQKYFDRFRAQKKTAPPFKPTAAR